MMRRIFVLMLSVCPVFTLAGGAAPPPEATRLPGPGLNLSLSAPITTRDEAVPLWGRPVVPGCAQRRP